MSNPIEIERRDLTGSQFTGVNLSGTRFDDVDLSEAVFLNINLRGTKFGAIDFGGAEFACMNTGENRPQRPATFREVELDGCSFEQGSFARVRIEGARLDGMTIDGYPVEKMMEIYRRTKAEEPHRRPTKSLTRWFKSGEHRRR